VIYYQVTQQLIEPRDQLVLASQGVLVRRELEKRRLEHILGVGPVAQPPLKELEEPRLASDKNIQMMVHSVAIHSYTSAAQLGSLADIHALLYSHRSVFR
jgi:hypothetical protein